MLATGCHDHYVRVLNTSVADKQLTVLKGHTAAVYNVLWNPIHTNLLLSGSNDKTLRVWNVDTQESTVLSGHTDNVRGLAWNYEIPYIAISGSWDGTLRVWDTRYDFCSKITNFHIRNGSCMSTIHEHYADIYGISSHRSRPFVYISSSRDSTVRMWSLDKFAEPVLLKSLYKLSLTDAIESKMVCSEYAQSLQFKNLDDAEKMAVLFNYLCTSNGFGQLWQFIKGKNENTSTEFAHWKSCASALQYAAKQVETTKVSSKFGSVKKMEALSEVASMYLKLGNFRSYCDTMVALGEWERAIAIAPSVSLDFWKELCDKYGKHLLAKQDENAAPYFAAISEIDKLINVYMSRKQFNDAALIASLDCQGTYKRIVAEPRLVQPSVPAQSVSAELKNIVQTRAESYRNYAKPVHAACCFLTIDDYRSACRELVLGNEPILAYALCKLYKLEETEELLVSLARLCIKNETWDLLLDVVQKLADKLSLYRVIGAILETSKCDIAKTYLKAGLQQPSFYATEAEKLSAPYSLGQLKTLVLGKQFQKAATACIALWADAFGKPAWDWTIIHTISAYASCIQLSSIDDIDAKKIQAYCYMDAAQHALWKSFYSLVPRLVRQARYAGICMLMLLY